MPREILPGQTYAIARRCTQRQFLLRPDSSTNAIIAYCLAEAARRYDVHLVAWLAMSNHYHAVVYDPRGRLPAFLEHLHKMLAKALNARWGRWENLWSTEETSVVHLESPHAIFDKVVYLLANPVAAHLVERLSDWPGCSALLHLAGAGTVHDRPRAYFRAIGGRMPPQVELRATLPPCVSANESPDAWAARVRAAVAEKERAAREERLRAGRSLLGRKGVLRTSAFSSPTTAEPRRRLRPTLAAKQRELRIAGLSRLMEFYRAHTAARLRFVAGERDVEFPAGTYRMRVWGASCAPFPIAA